MFRSTFINLAQLIGAAVFFFAVAAFLRPDLFGSNENTISTAGTPAAATATPATRSKKAGVVALSANANGHFEVAAMVEGRHTEMLADTGASVVALTYEDAERLGLKPSRLDFTIEVNTANGKALFAPTTLDKISIGPITVRNVEAAIAERGKLHTNLLGMSFIGRISRFELKGNQLVLHR